MIRIQYDSTNTIATTTDPDVPTVAAEQPAEQARPLNRIVDVTAQNAMLKRQSDNMNNPGRAAQDRELFTAKLEEYNSTLEIQQSLINGGRHQDAKAFAERQEHRLHDLAIVGARLGIDLNDL